MENHPIDQLFKERLGNFEQNPPVDLMDKINQEVISRGKVRRMNQIKTIVSIAAALVLIIMAGWFTTDLNYFSENKAPALIHPNISPEQPNLEKELQIPQKSENKLLVYQQKSVQSTVSQHIKQSKKVQGRRNLISNLSTVTGNVILADQTSGKESATSVQSREESTKKQLQEETPLKKEKVKPEPESNTAFQKKKEPIYYTDSRFNSTTPSKGSGKGNWGIKAEISPMFAAQKQVGVSPDTKSVNTVSGGMIAFYKLNDRVTISSGVRFSQMKQGTHSDYTMSKTSGITYLQPVQKDADISSDVSLYLPAVSSIVYSNGMQAATNNVFGSDISQDFQYLEIPIQASYKLIDKMFSVGLTGGISTNFLIGNIASITENGIKLSQGNTDNLRNVLYSGSAGIELGYELNKNMVLTVEPRIKQYLHSVSSNDMVNFKPLQFGIFTGITYYFN